MDRGAWWATVHGITKKSGMTATVQHQQQAEFSLAVIKHTGVH